jgi:hypothetical protein
VLEFAVLLLRKKGRFFPFGAVVWADSAEVQLAAAPADRAPANDPAGLLQALVTELAVEAEAGRIRAAATCADVRGDPEVGAAIRVDVETADGDVRTALQPYRRRFPRRFVLESEVVERPGLPKGIFTRPG